MRPLGERVGGDQGKLSEQNKATAKAVFEVWSTGDVGRLDELVAAQVVHHDPYDPNAAEGLPGMKRTIEFNRTAFPDMRLTVEDQVAESFCSSHASLHRPNGWRTASFGWRAVG